MSGGFDVGGLLSSAGSLGGAAQLLTSLFGSGETQTNANSNSNVNGTTKVSQNNMDANSLDALHTLLGTLLGKTQANDTGNATAPQNSQYTKDQAIADSQGLVGQIFNQYSKTALPTIFSTQNSSGGYNSTSGQLLANDAFGKATADAASAVQQNIKDYAAISNSNTQTAQNQQSLDLTSLLAALGVAKGATQTSNTDVNTTTNTQTQQTSDNKGILGSLF